MIALTFDDGPHPVWTAKVLAELARADVRATFFPLSPHAFTYPELIAQIRDAGHQVGLHGWHHLKHPEHPREVVAADTDRALEAFDEPPEWWRLPYGMEADFSADLAAERGLRIAGFTVDTHDWRGDEAGAMLAAARPGLADGAIVLLHDALGPGVRRPDCAQTVALIGPLVAAARELGHELGRLDELATVTTARPG